MTIKEFDTLYEQRHEPDSLNSCLKAVSEFNDSNIEQLTSKSDMEWLWRLAKVKHFQFMQERENNPKNAQIYITTAKKAAIAALKIDGDRIENVFWGATCELEEANLHGKVATFGVLGRAQRALDRACVIDESYHFGGPPRVLGRLIQLKPLFLGGNLDRALAFYNRALQIYPRNSTTLLYKADALISDRQPIAARKTLHFLLEESDSSNWKWETTRDKELASKWLNTRL
jgi:tetratricopeptide (TPR) repeat protein